MSIAALENDLKDGKLSAIYLLYGKETFLLENSLKKIKKIFGNLQEGLNYIKIDNTNANMLISELQTPPFGFEKKLVIVKDTDLLKKQGKKKSSVILESIEKIVDYFENNIEDIKAQNVVVFIEEEIEKNDLFKMIEKERNCL